MISYGFLTTETLKLEKYISTLTNGAIGVGFSLNRIQFDAISCLSISKKTNISFEFNKIERNVPLDFPFSVPKRFDLIN